MTARQIGRTVRRNTMVTNFKSPIEQQVDRLFSEIKTKHGECCVNPVTGTLFVRGIDSIRTQKKAAIGALRAREWFAVNGPPDAPPLPLSAYEHEDYRHGRGLRQIVGFFGRSLEANEYDFHRHPSFEDFARGLMAMAVDGGLWGLEHDAQLKKRFPPRRLPGMTPGAYWAPPKEYEAIMASYRREREARLRTAIS
jgi:hypothetical protein